MIKINRQGCTRIVFLTKRYAIKIPICTDGFQAFLYGLLANMQERLFGRLPWYQEMGTCPIVFSLPYGLLVVMPRVREMTDEEFLEFDVDGFLNQGSYRIPGEAKSNSFGWLNGKVVIIDYGS